MRFGRLSWIREKVGENVDDNEKEMYCSKKNHNQKCFKDSNLYKLACTVLI
jgi:hypothetical protein